MFRRSIPVVLLLAFSPVMSAAEEPGDLAKLREGYQKDLATAAVPVRARYAEKLQALLKACVQRGDLDGAVAVRSELESLKAEASGAASAPKGGAAAIEAFRKALSGTTWTWPTKYKDGITVTFLDDGTFQTPPWGGKFTWEVVEKNSVRLVSEKFGSASMTFNDALTSYEGFDFRTKDPMKGTRVAAGSQPATKPQPSGGSGSSGGSAFGKPSP